MDDVMDEHRFDDDGGANHEDDYEFDLEFVPSCDLCGAYEGDYHGEGCPRGDQPFEVEQ
jgi:hypothetical protein